MKLLEALYSLFRRRKPVVEYIPPPPPPPIVYATPKPFAITTDIVDRIDWARRSFEMPVRELKRFRLLLEIKPTGKPEPFFVELGHPVSVLRDRTTESVKMEYEAPPFMPVESLVATGLLLVDEWGKSCGPIKPFPGGSQALNAGDTLYPTYHGSYNGGSV